MKKKNINLAMTVLVGIISGGFGSAFASDIKYESDKADAVKRIIARKAFYLQQPEKPFCRQLLEDFRVLKNMSFIEPVARAEHYDDPVLEPYKTRCGELPLNEKFACDPRATQDVKWSKNPKEKRQQLLRFCHLYTGTANFKVYDIDIDNDPKNGKELIMYFEQALGRDYRGDNVYWDGGYNVFDRGNCAQIHETMTNDPYNNFWKRHLDNYNGIIFYKGRYYIFDLSDLDPSGKYTTDNPSYYLRVSTVGNDRSHSCSYSTIPPSTKPAKEPQ